MFYRATMDEIGYEMTVTEHDSLMSAIIADQEESSWYIKEMRTDDEGNVITTYFSDRNHFAISAISKYESDARYIVDVAFEDRDQEYDDSTFANHNGRFAEND